MANLVFISVTLKQPAFLAENNLFGYRKTLKLEIE